MKDENKKMKDMRFDADWLSFWIGLWLTIFQNWGDHDIDLYDALIHWLTK